MSEGRGDVRSQRNGVCRSPLQADREAVRVHLSGLQKRKECLFLYLCLHKGVFLSS